MIDSNCPVCGENDAVQKVTAIIWDGQSQGTYAGFAGGHGAVMHGRSTSLLAKLLMPPERPKEPGRAPVEWLLVPVAFVAINSVVSCVLFMLAYLLISGTPPEPGSIRSDLAMFICTMPLPVSAILCIPVVIYVQKYSRQNAERHELAKKAYRETTVPKYEAALKRWDNAYYCSRDDIVFEPGTQWKCSPDEFLQSLSSEPGMPDTAR